MLSEESPSLNVAFSAVSRTLYRSSYREYYVSVTNNCATGDEETTGSILYNYGWTQTSGPTQIVDTGHGLSSITNRITLDNSFTATGIYTI